MERSSRRSSLSSHLFLHEVIRSALVDPLTVYAYTIEAKLEARLRIDKGEGFEEEGGGGGED